MAETVKGTRSNGVYKVNQRTGEVTYEGQYGGRGSQAIRNSIRTVGARTAARTAAAYRTNSTNINSTAANRADFRISGSQALETARTAYERSRTRPFSSYRGSSVPTTGARRRR